MVPVRSEPGRPVGDVYEPVEDPPGRRPPPREETTDAGTWPASAYEPAASLPESSDSALARLLLDRLTASGREPLHEGADVLPLEAPELRARVLDRLETELGLHEPELLVATGRGAAEVGAVLADRTGLPLLPADAVPGDAGRREPTRVAIVGGVLRPGSVAGVVRAVEARSASVVAIVGVAIQNGEDTELISDHYNVFTLLAL